MVLAYVPGKKTSTRYYLGRAALTATSVRSVKVEFLSGEGWTVKITFTRSGSARWDRLARQQFHKPVAIVIDSLVESMPAIQPNESVFSSFKGTAVLSGHYTSTEASDLAKLINYAAASALFILKSVTVK